ncbi:MAG: GerAB/ArcD/ProY family transporter, partial [Nostocaceae cyanobacterium]|nr:GerAB/ArcD/ProY family transporter [Nostocaceae cyanobacterium]
MNRYVFYTIWCNLLTIGFLFVNRLLLDDRFNGSITAILLSTIVGSLFLIFFSKALEQFPKQGLPEIFNLFFPKWVTIPLIFFFSIMIITEGCIILGVISLIITRFLLPNLASSGILVLFFLAIGWGASRSSKTVLSALELILIITTPLLYFIFIKGMFNPVLEWNAVKVMKNYIWMVPKWRSIAEASNTFSEFIALTIFNRIVPSKIKGWFIC